MSLGPKLEGQWDNLTVMYSFTTKFPVNPLKTI